MLEKEIEAKFTRWCKVQGYECIKLTSPGRKGVPDRMVLAPNGLVFFVELKRPGGELTTLQKRTHEKWGGLGHFVFTAYGLEEACDYISNAVHASRLPRGSDNTSSGESSGGPVSRSGPGEDGDYTPGDSVTYRDWRS